MATRVSSARFVGRAAELAELNDALAAARDGRPALAFVAGESGVGKTRLLCELERAARADGVRVLTGECVDLGESELAEQLADILDETPDHDLVERLWARSEGNALYAEELLAAGVDGRGALPPTLREALMIRVEKLALSTQDILRTLAVAGRTDHALLAEATGLPPDVLRDALRDGVSSQIVRVLADGSYALRHALLGEVIADDLLPGERSELHLALARALESHAAPGAHNASAIAHHYVAAGDQPRALAAAVRAGEAAEAVRAYGEAAALYERGLELWDRVADAEALTGTDHVDLLRAAAFCNHIEGESDRAEALLRAAADETDPAADPTLLSRILERLAWEERRQGRATEAWATLERALALLPSTPSAERAMVLASMGKHLMIESRLREGAERSREALESARAAGALEPEIRALDALGVCLAWLGDPTGVGYLREAIALASEHGELLRLNTLYTNLADVLLWRGTGREARNAAEEGIAYLEAGGHLSHWMRLTRAEIAFALGDWPAAAAELPEHGRRLQHNLLVNESHRRAELALGHGEHDRAGALLDAIEPFMARSREPQFVGPQAAMRAELARRRGDLATARDIVEEGLDRIEFCSEDSARISLVSLAGLAVEADAAVRARDLGEDPALPIRIAEMLLLRLEATAGEGRPVENANLATGRARFARAQGDADPALWAAAADAWTGIERPYPAAEARWREAEARLEAGDREGAAATAATALEPARTIGATWLASEVEGFLTRARLSTGEDASAASDDDPFGLTPRERQVLELLAAGATNREIGTTLYMAEKTASVHVSRILAKLDVRTRTEAAAVAHRLGLT